MLRFVTVLAAIAVTAAPAWSKERPMPPSPHITALSNCQRLTDGAARLACYDRVAPALVGATRSGDIRVVDRESVRQARRTLFGFPLSSVPFFGGDDTAPAKVQSTILNFSSIGNGFYRFTIAQDRAVWESTEAMNVRDAKHGDPVTITRTKIGSYWAKIGNRRDLRVRRVR